MRKFLASVCTAVTIALLAVVFAACGTKSYVGTYKFASMSMTGTGMSMEYVAGQSVMGVTITEDAYVLEIKEDGTFTMDVNMMGETSSVSGTWKEESGAITMTSEGEGNKATLDGGKLIMQNTIDGMTTKIVFNKK